VGSSASLASPPVPPPQEDVPSGAWLQDAEVGPQEPAQPPPADPGAAVADPQASGSLPVPTEPPSSEAVDTAPEPPEFNAAQQTLVPETMPPVQAVPADDESESMRALSTFDIPPDLEERSAEQAPVAEPSAPFAVSGPIAEGPVASDDDGAEPPARKGLGLLFAFVGLIVVLVIGGGLIGLFALLRDPAPSDVEVPVVAQPEPIEPTSSPGLASDSIGSVVLAIQPSAGGSVTITSALGFKQTWDGVGERNFDGIPAGTYRTKVKTNAGDSVRSTFEVVEDQTCKYTLDLAGGSEEWHGEGCE
jgi:hypothetical protein